MSIFLNKSNKVIVQGITGGEGTKHTALMLRAGTQVVGGVNARKAGTTVEHGDVTLPVFGTVVEAIEAEIPLVVVITEGIPVQDAAEFWALAKEKGNLTRIIGPNCPGII